METYGRTVLGFLATRKMKWQYKVVTDVPSSTKSCRPPGIGPELSLDTCCLSNRTTGGSDGVALQGLPFSWCLCGFLLATSIFQGVISISNSSRVKQKMGKESAVRQGLQKLNASCYNSLFPICSGFPPLTPPHKARPECKRSVYSS